MSFIFASDLHLDRDNHTWRQYPQIQGDSIASLEFLLQLCTKLPRVVEGTSRHAYPLVLGGDVFDSYTKVSPGLLQRVIVLFNRYPDVKVFYIDGNHDKVTPSWCSLLPRATRLSDTPVHCGDITVKGFDFTTAEDLEQQLQNAGESDVTVIHQTLDCFINMPYAIPHKLPWKSKYVLAGDFHMPITYMRDSIEFHSSGSTNRRTIKEGRGRCIFVCKSRDKLGSLVKATGFNENNVTLTRGELGTYYIPLPTRPVAILEDTEEFNEQQQCKVEEMLQIESVTQPFPQYGIELISTYFDPTPIVAIYGDLTKDIIKSWKDSEFMKDKFLMTSHRPKQYVSWFEDDERPVQSTLEDLMLTYIKDTPDLNSQAKDDLRRLLFAEDAFYASEQARLQELKQNI